MNRLLMILLTALVSTVSLAQVRVVKPELPNEESGIEGFLPDPGVPLPDSVQTPEIIQFYEGRIENLNGLKSRNDQTVILYCLAELRRLSGLHEEALLTMLDAHRSFNGELSARDEGLFLSRLCFSCLPVMQGSENTGITSRVYLELGYPNFESMMQASIGLLEEVEDEKTLPSLLKLAFDYYTLFNSPQIAFGYGDKLIRYKDKLSSKELKSKLSALKDDYAVAQKEREIVLLNNQKIIFQERIRATARERWAIFAGIAVLLIFLIALWNRIRVIGKTRDMLQLKAAQLQHEKNRAEKSELFKEQFLANVSHEIRTPMNAIMGITNILIKNKHLKTQEKYLTAMHESAKNLLGLINDILDLSKLEAGKVELVNAPFSPQEIIADLSQNLRGKAESKGLQFKVSVEENVPEFVTGDGFVLNNILVNLMGNAISFTGSGSVELKCSLAGENDGVVTLLFAVSDTGLGIIPEKQEKILTTFVKVYEKASMNYEGSGLELAIINQLVDLQGGKMSLKSEPNVGTTFYIEIPYTLPSHLPLMQKIEAATDEDELKDITVLLVEDNEFNVMVATSELESVIDGVVIDLAENGKIAVDKMMENLYDLVLMDVQMPVMDGYEATRMIRKMNGNTGKTPIIAMTANVLQQEVDRCLQEGMNDYISKPFDTSELLDKMKRLIRAPR